MLNYSMETFEEIYNFFKQISGSHNGFINNKIYQISPSNEDICYCAMTCDFPNYGRLLGYQHEVTYHLSGYGCNREEALIRLIGESLERYSVVYAYEFLKNSIIYKTYDEIKSSMQNVMGLEYLNVYKNNSNRFVKYISSEDTIGWVELLNIQGDKKFCVPAQMFFLSYFNNSKLISENKAYFSVSTGTATHTSYEKSLENALVEYLQIDSFMLFWYSKNAKGRKVILNEEFKKFIKDKKLLSDKHDLLVIDMTLDKPFIVYGVFIIGKEYPYFSFGVQAGKDPYHTLYRAILEATTILQYNYSSPIYDEYKYTLGHDVNNEYLDLDSNVVFWASEMKNEEKLNFLHKKIEGEIGISEFSTSEVSLLELCINYCNKNDYSIGCLDITCPEIGKNNWNTVRCIIPELLPMCIPGLPFNSHPRMKQFGGCINDLPHPLP